MANNIKKIKVRSDEYAEFDAVNLLDASGGEHSYEDIVKLGFHIVKDEPNAANTEPKTTASEETMHSIYLVQLGEEVSGSCTEFITLKTEVTPATDPKSYTYKWEKIGTTTLDLKGYLKKGNYKTDYTAIHSHDVKVPTLAAKTEVVTNATLATELVTRKKLQSVVLNTTATAERTLTYAEIAESKVVVTDIDSSSNDLNLDVDSDGILSFTYRPAKAFSTVISDTIPKTVSWMYAINTGTVGVASDTLVDSTGAGDFVLYGTSGTDNVGYMATGVINLNKATVTEKTYTTTLDGSHEHTINLTVDSTWEPAE